ncbi:MAG: hypothetical protein HY914_01460 [Desulfomonile tiedjei]|nr:hypothetical protein [Desulfomonile tiedjei]
MGRLDIGKLFRDEAEELVKARDRCIQTHGTNIRAAGNEVEMAVRKFFRRMLPTRFHVTQGHLIDRDELVSPQLDLIISDNTSIPALFTTYDETSYIPIDCVYAVGEVKSTFRRSKNYIDRFAKTLHFIREEMTRPLVENTMYDGIKDSTLLRDSFLGKPNRYLNPLFSFMVFVNSGDADENALEKAFTSTPHEDLPGITGLLNMAVVVYGKIAGDIFSFEKYPWMGQSPERHWLISPLQGATDTESVEGNHLGMIYYALLEHLNQSFLEPLDLRSYFRRMLVGRRSTSKKIGDS